MESDDDNIPLRPRGRGIYLLPNLFTTAGMFGGFFAIMLHTKASIVCLNYEETATDVKLGSVASDIAGKTAR